MAPDSMMKIIHEIDHEHKFINVTAMQNRSTALRGNVYFPPQKGLDELVPDASPAEKREREEILDTINGIKLGHLSRRTSLIIGRAFPRVYPDKWQPTGDEMAEIQLQFKIAGEALQSVKTIQHRIKEYTKAFAYEKPLTCNMEPEQNPEQTRSAPWVRKLLVPKSQKNKLTENAKEAESNAISNPKAKIETKGKGLLVRVKRALGENVAPKKAVKRNQTLAEILDEMEGPGHLERACKRLETAGDETAGSLATATPLFAPFNVNQDNIVSCMGKRIETIGYEDIGSLATAPPLVTPIVANQDSLVSVVDKPAPTKEPLTKEPPTITTLINGHPAEWYQPSAIRWAPGVLHKLFTYSVSHELEADETFAAMKASVRDKAREVLAQVASGTGKERANAGDTRSIASKTDCGESLFFGSSPSPFEDANDAEYIPDEESESLPSLPDDAKDEEYIPDDDDDDQ